MQKFLRFIILVFILFSCSGLALAQNTKKEIKAIYVSLADHYAGIIAYEKYRDQMEHADYVIKKMNSWPELRAYFMSGQADMAFVMSPYAMDMFLEDPKFRWIGLMHRDGNALAVNGILAEHMTLHRERIQRKPSNNLSDAYTIVRLNSGEPSEIAVPSLLATHTVVLYKYLKDHNLTLGLAQGEDKDVIAVEVAPHKSPAFIKKKGVRGIPASFTQSLPWADVVETNNFGKIVWYSKDVLPWPNGHVECIIIASDEAIKNKRDALKEIVNYIHQSGADIEEARKDLKKPIDDIVDVSEITAISKMLQKHVPEHNESAIIQSLRYDLNVINYKNLNIDKGGLKQVMNLAVESGILSKPIDIDAFADESFLVEGMGDAEYDEIDYSIESGYELSENVRGSLQQYVADFKQLAAMKVIIDAVREKNFDRMSIQTIKKIDYAWVHDEAEDFQSDLMNTRISHLLRDEVQSHGNIYTEIFLCDRQGALVGLYPKTSDYWQGDEEKFIKSYNDGDGRVFIGGLEYDESTKSFAVQISIPVQDDDQTIGVMVVGVRNIK